MRPALLISTLACLGCLAAAPPTPATLEPAFHNTIVSTYPDGRQARLWLDADGGYRAEGRRKDLSDGTWRLKGAEICLKQRRPASIPLAYCTGVPTGGVGASWTAKSVFGDPLKVKLVAGR